MADRSFPLADVERGKVKFFNGEKGFGYIIPANKKGREIFFLNDHFAGPVEKERGKLVMALARKLPYAINFQPPAKSTEVVYLVIWTRHGPMTRCWTFANEWDQARRRISGRLSPDSVLVRVKQAEPAQGILRPMVVWEGEHKHFVQKIKTGFAAKLNETAIVEECLATGWMPMDYSSL